MADDSNWIRILEMGHDAAKVMWKITKFMSQNSTKDQ